MRVHFILALAFGLSVACGSNSHNLDASPASTSVADKAKDVVGGITDAPFNFSSAIYIVPDDNFWSGCSGAATGEACRADRLFELEAGVEQWLAYFPVEDRPVIVVATQEDLPRDVSNLQVIDFYVDGNRCTGVDVDPCSILWACYEPLPKDIVFMKDEFVTAQVVAHELGHAFGLPHSKWLNDGCASPIMSRPVQSKVVTDLDMQFLCWKHPEVVCPVYHGSLYETMLDTISCDKFWEPETENTCK